MKRPLATAGLTVLLTQWMMQMLPSAVYLPLAVIFVLFFVIFCRKKSKNPKLACVFAAAAVSALWLFCYEQCVIRPMQKVQTEGASIEAVVTDAKESFSPGLSRVYLHITSCGGSRVSYRAVCDYFPKSEIGDVITARAVLSPLHGKREKQYCYPDSVHLRAECSEVHRTGRRFSLQAVMNPLQQKISRQIRWAAEGENGQILAAMLTGDRTSLSGETRYRFQQAGVSHILAVSGLHISMVVFTFFTLMCYILQRRRPAALLSMLLLFFYMFFTGLSPSVLRAGMMAALLLAGEIFYKKSDSFTAMGLAALLLVFYNPYCVMDAGTLFSFSATCGVLAAGKVERKIRKASKPGFAGKLTVPAGVLLVPLFAMLFTLPVQMSMGGSVSVFGLFANILVVPAVQPLLLLGILAVLCLQLPLLLPVSRFLFFLMDWLLFYIKKVVSFTGEIPFGKIAMGDRFLQAALLLGILLCLMLFRKHKMLACTVPVLLFLFAAGISHLAVQDVILAAEVGYGRNKAVVLLYENKSAVLFRGGESNVYAVRQYLDEKGIRQADILINMEKQPRDAVFQRVFGKTADENLRHSTFCGKTKRLNHAIILEMEQQKTGALCSMWVDDIHLLVTSGTTDVRGRETAAVLLPAGRKITGAAVQSVVCGEKLPVCTEINRETSVYTDMERAEIWIKPQKGFWIREGG